MSPRAKEKIREDVQDAMAEEEEGKFQTKISSENLLKEEIRFAGNK